MTATSIYPDEYIGDMNGPIGYWGPATTAGVRVTRPAVVAGVRHDAGCAALGRLAETFGGYTWTGTAALMDAAFQQAASTTLRAEQAAA
ncbi:MAG: hypothetical protein AB7R89_02040 [Dehalococcoidia bacterium]